MQKIIILIIILLFPIYLYSDEVLSLTKISDAPATNIPPLATNITIMAFNISDISNGHTLDSLKIQNWLVFGEKMIQDSEISNVELWIDNGTQIGRWDNNDTYVKNLISVAGDIWSNSGFGVDIYNGGAGQNFIITIDITAKPIVGRQFRGNISKKWMRCSAGAYNTNSNFFNSYFQTIKNEALKLTKLVDIPSTNFVAKQTNVVVCYFNVTDYSNGHSLNFLRIRNLGLMDQDNEISNVKLWIDSGSQAGKWDSGDTFVKNLLPESPTMWTNSGFGIDIYNGGAGQDFIVTLDITSSPVDGKKFQAVIGPGYVKCNDNGINTNTLKNNFSQVINIPPDIPPESIVKLNLDNLIIGPNPFKPNDNNFETGTATGGIKFANLTADAMIEIYTVAGQLIEKLEETDGDGKYIWIVPDRIASGGYICRITNSKGEEKIRKIIIIK